MTIKLVLDWYQPVPPHLLPGCLVEIFNRHGEPTGSALWVPPTFAPNRDRIRLGSVTLRLTGRRLGNSGYYSDWKYLRLQATGDVPIYWFLEG